VFNVVTGDPVAIGGELTANPIVRKLSFTGSTEVGRLLMAQCAPTIKKLSLELGGNAPFIVFDDADVDAAVEGAIASKYRNTGQTCVCANRLLVQDGVYDAFAAKLPARWRSLKVGDGSEPGVVQGPLIEWPGWPRSRRTSPTPLPRAPACSPAASAMRAAATSSSRPCWPT
jgi:succinate-semialdehyde dehydrogenase/glutarate-semialdehyde dehydrogenase